MIGPIRATLMDVAREARVSPKTVSRVMNREPNVREETRDRVLLAARALGYRPNPAARSLAASRSFLIAHLHDNSNRDYVGRTNDGIYAACRRAGYYLLPERLPIDARDRGEQVDRFLDTSRVDGVVLSPPLSDDREVISRLTERGVPFVLISPEASCTDYPMIVRDQKSAGRSMTEHLIGLGHRRIAFIAGPRNHGAALARQVGYEEAMRDAGLACGPVGQGDFLFRSGIEVAETLLTAGARPTAIFAANDQMAAGAMAYALRAGFSVPGDLSVAGFDDTELSQATWPPLSTVRQPVEEMGSEAANLLIELSTGQAPGETGEPPQQFELVIRESTGSVPG